MKYINNLLTGCLLACGLASCEKDLPVYGTDICRLNFDYDQQNALATGDVEEKMRELFYTCMEGVETDTLWVNVSTMGYLADEDRPFAMQQVMTGKNDAVAGKHYVAFDDKDAAAHYYIPKNQASARIPIIIKRDPALKDGNVVLKFAFKENDWFQPGYPEFGYYVLTISGKLTKPTMWDLCYLDGYFGAYGSVKHGLMKRWTQQEWDNAYLETLFYEFTFTGGVTAWMPRDENYIDWLASWFAQKLKEENAERLEAGESPWQEELPDGTKIDVDFTAIR